MQRPIYVPAVLALLAMAACSPQPPGPDGTPPQAREAAGPAGDAVPPATAPADGQPAAGADLDPCDPAAVQSLIGEQANDEVVEQARIDAGAQIVRTLRPDQVVTMEYRAGRLNIDVDDAGTITGFRCG